tara:strand:- start:4065 stop:4823 length:759 start_codon:yes stop_codon:yes gene_type:complete
MGNLHAGHVSLVKEAVKEHDVTVVTIFVNPKQFGPGEDFDRYPRTLQEDLEALKEVHGQIVVFAPSTPEEIYPEGFSTQISLPDISSKLCGKSRPTHFAGVTTVVYQLFAIAKPKTAFFGLKDYQQVKIIETMTKDLRLPVRIRALPIIREPDGLAMSSRNRYLSADQRPQALILSKTLQKAKEIMMTQGIDACVTFINESKSQPGWDYLELLHADSLRQISSGDRFFVLAGALYVGETRLIDNLVVELDVR